MPEETLDLYSLLDCCLLKTSFSINAKSLSPEQQKITSTVIYDTLTFLRQESVFTALTTSSRLVIAKTKKDKIQDYLTEQKASLGIAAELDNNFSWSWIEFTMANLTKQELAVRYNNLIADGLLQILKNLLLATKETSTHSFKLKGKEEKLELLSSLELIFDSKSKQEFIKLLLEAKDKILSAENTATNLVSATSDIQQAIKNDIVKVRKAPRKVILC